MLNRVVIAAALTLAIASSAAAQTSTTIDNDSQHHASDDADHPVDATSTMETRPATTTFMGDTGLWYVPTGEVLPRKKWSMSAYRVNFDDNQGFTRRLELAADLRLSASAIAPRSSGRGSWSAASTVTSGRCSCRRSRAPAASCRRIR